LAERTRAQLEAELLPAFLARQRWYAAKGEEVKPARLVEHALFEADTRQWLLAQVQVEGSESARYFLPLALAWEETEEERTKQLAPAAIAKVRQQASVGLLADAAGEPAFCAAAVAAVAARRELRSTRGKLRFAPTAAFERIAGKDPSALAPVRALAMSSNTAVLLGEKLFIKWYRRLRDGENPELEMGRFLTDVARFEHCVPVAGSIDYVTGDGTVRTLALLQAFVPNQGDAWTAAVDQLARHLESQRSGKSTAVEMAFDGFLALMKTLGQRTAELHAALARRTGDAAFDPEPISEADLAQWVREARADAAATFNLLAARHDALPAALLDTAQRLFAAGPRLQGQLGSDLRVPPAGLKTRIHGDYHLGQVLLVHNDFTIIDFEGEPARDLAERRRKHSALRDVAGMLRSFDYARHAALLQVAHSDADVERMAPAATDWAQCVRTAFLDAYRHTAVAGGLYQDDAQFDAVQPLLGFFETEKALYELRYELNNRPDWVAVPLAGLSELLATASR
jgi:maltose alpha-D-glucosyltransferase/alpha-amylase